MDNTLPVLTNEHLTTIMNLPAEHNSRLQKAKEYYDANIAHIIELPLSDFDEEKDEILNNFCATISTTKKDMTSKRAPFFRAVDDYRSLFTGVEKELEMLGDNAKKKRDAVFTYRDNKRKEAERIKAEEIRIKALVIDYRQQIQYTLNEWATSKLGQFKEALLKSFNECTMSNVDTIAQRLQSILNETSFPIASWPGLPKNSAFEDIPEDTRQVIYDSEIEKININPFYESRAAFVMEYLAKIPNKRAELEAEEKASKEERDRIEKQREDFKKAEQERINREIEESNSAAANRGVMAAEAEKGQQIFDAIPTEAEFAPKGAREDAELKITTIEGYTKVIGLWLRHEAPNIPLEELPKKAISVMITFAKKRYLATGEKIECAGIDYIDKVTSRVTKK